MKNLLNTCRQNAALMDQAIEALAHTPDQVYAWESELFPGQRIGAQVRHVIEFYESLFNGLEHNRVDYDARRRDPVVERDPRVAADRLLSIRERLLKDEALTHDRALWITPEGGGASAAYALSSLSRELQAVESHTVHHFALIAILLQRAGAPVPAGFGVSRATLLHWSQTGARGAA